MAPARRRHDASVLADHLTGAQCRARFRALGQPTHLTLTQVRPQQLTAGTSPSLRTTHVLTKPEISHPMSLFH